MSDNSYIVNIPYDYIFNLDKILNREIFNMEKLQNE